MTHVRHLLTQPFFLNKILLLKPQLTADHKLKSWKNKFWFSPFMMTSNNSVLLNVGAGGAIFNILNAGH